MSFGEAVAYGAATIINAMATGKGAAFGVNLWTKASVQLNNDVGQIECKILSEPNEDTVLIREAILSVLKYFKFENKFGAYAETESTIPIAKGLKSSSAAANALVLASVAALSKKLNDTAVLNLSVNAAISAKTTITGAFDDTCASYFGNIVITDNKKRKILQQYEITKGLAVIFHIPHQKSYSYKTDLDKIELIAPQVDLAFKEALSGHYWKALTLNGMLYSASLGYRTDLTFAALKAGALAAGLSGKGPATVAVAHREVAPQIIDAWSSYEGNVILADINQQKATVI